MDSAAKARFEAQKERSEISDKLKASQQNIEQLT